MKYLVLCLLIMMITGCLNDTEKDKAKLVDDGKYVAGIHLPKDAINKRYIGNGWFYFKLGRDCFIIADKGRTSVMSKASCVN